MIKKIWEGREIMLFDEDGKSFAYSQNHTLNLTISTSDVSSKDHGVFSSTTVTNIGWEITSSNLACDEFHKLFFASVEHQPITVKFGIKKESDDLLPAEGDIECYTLDGTQLFYTGRALITSLNLSAQNGEKSTYDITLTGISKLVQTDDLRTVSTVDATQFESLTQGFLWKGWQSMSQHNPVSIGWDDNTVGNHSVQPNNVAYFVPQYNFNNLYVYSQIPNTQKMEITFRFVHEFDEEFDVTINGDSIHSPISGTRYSLTLDGGDNTITIQSNSFPDIRVRITEIKIYYIEDNN